MENTQTGKEGIIEKLRAMQFAETAKNADRMDAGLVDLLTDMLLDLDGESPIGQAEHDAGIRSILDRISTPSAQAKHKRTLRRLLIAAIIATLIFAAGLVYITLGSQGNPDQFKWAHYIIEHLLPGRSIDTDNGVTIYNDGKSKKYDSIESYLKQEKLKVLYPSVLPGGYVLTGIQVFKDIDPEITRITYITNDSRHISISVDLNHSLPNEIRINCNSTEVINGFHCYFASDEHWHQCVFSFENNLYTIDATSYDEVEEVILHMKGT